MSEQYPNNILSPSYGIQIDYEPIRADRLAHIPSDDRIATGWNCINSGPNSPDLHPPNAYALDDCAGKSVHRTVIQHDLLIGPALEASVNDRFEAM